MEIGERTPLLSLRSQRRVRSRRQQQRHNPTATNATSLLVRRGNNHSRMARHWDDNSDSACRCGTHEGAGIWWSHDLSGSFMALAVWICFICVIGTIVSRTNHVYFTGWLCTTSGLALASHAKTALTDPGTVPHNATVRTNAYCALCQAGKPIYAHHCRTCRRCICRMDHHCPWVKNCIGAANMKHFVLFLVYTWISSILALVESVYLEYFGGLLFSVFGLTFVTYILSHTLTSIRTGLGAIDRLQMTGKLPVVSHRVSRGLLFSEIFGRNILSWWLPVDPRFRDPEKIFGYTTTTTGNTSNYILDTYDHEDEEERLSPRTNAARSRSPKNRQVYQTQRWEFPTEAVDI